jgi:hypothetical protein
MQAREFAVRNLFLADPDEGFPTTSVAVRQLASDFCEHVKCTYGPVPCRKHQQSMLIGVAKLIAGGDVFAEMSSRGVVFVRLSPAGVLALESWSSVPVWFLSKPDLVEWARNDASRRRWEARV